MANPIFDLSRCPGLAGLMIPPALDFGPLVDCDVPDPLQPVTVCATFDLPPAVPVITRALHITLTAASADGSVYSWREAVPDGSGGWLTGPRSGSIATYTGGYEINGLVVPAPASTVYPATLIGGTGKCTFIAGLPNVAYNASAAGAVLYVQLTAYNLAANAYDWRQVVSAGGGSWAPTGTTGTASSGAGAVEQNGLPALANGANVYKAARDSAGRLVFAAQDGGLPAIALTPSGGIGAASSSTTPGSATVALYYLQGGAIVPVGVTWTMYNMDPNDAVAGSTYVQGKWTSGLQFLHDYELCPAGG